MPTPSDNINLKYAIAYAKLGFSVIPCRPDKKPIVPWKEYQYKRAEKDLIEKWWRDYPNANVGIVTGEISGINVVDCDTAEAYQLLNDEYLPASFETPIVKTPKGYHVYFEYQPGLSNQVRAIAGTDLRTDGGYVVCPPSRNGSGSGYVWLEGLGPKSVKPLPMPSFLFDVLQQFSGSAKLNNPEKHIVTHNDNVTNRNITFNEGGRNDTLFHLIWHLKKSGMPLNEIEQYSEFFGKNCNPPIDTKEIQAAVKSAQDRKRRSNTGITQAVEGYIDVSSGWFSIEDCLKDVLGQYGQSVERSSLRAILHRMAKEHKLIERDPTRNGFFRKLDTECEDIDFINCDVRKSDISLPLGLNELVEIYPGNVIMIAGVSNMGKTAFMIDMIHRNMHKFDVIYFNSEMDGKELNKRLSDFGAVESIRDWKFKSKGVVENMEDVIVSGEGKINIIDYLELDKDHYRINGIIKRIHARLNGAIAVIAIQKKPGVDVGVGGYGTIYKARLALNIEKGECHIFKAKNWASRRNPNGLKRNFEIVDGWDLSGRGEWRRDT